MRPGRAHFAGVLGWPLEHTLSPAIHNAAFRALGLDWTYLAFPVPPESLRAAIAGLRALGATGANVTMPHKEAVVALLDDVSGDARALGAVNTIQRVGDLLVGHNTDVDGFREFLAGDAGVDVRARCVLLLGSGGAARAVVKALDELDAGEIVVCARRLGAARQLTELAAPGRVWTTEWARAEAQAARADVIVNATPIGMHAEDPLPQASLGEGQVVVDLVYQPQATPLMERARAAGAQAWGGLGMLVHQGAASFRIWTGQDAPIETMSAAAVRAIGGIGHSGAP